MAPNGPCPCIVYKTPNKRKRGGGCPLVCAVARSIPSEIVGDDAVRRDAEARQRVGKGLVHARRAGDQVFGVAAVGLRVGVDPAGEIVPVRDQLQVNVGQRASDFVPERAVGEFAAVVGVEHRHFFGRVVAGGHILEQRADRRNADAPGDDQGAVCRVVEGVAAEGIRDEHDVSGLHAVQQDVFEIGMGFGNPGGEHQKAVGRRGRDREHPSGLFVGTNGVILKAPQRVLARRPGVAVRNLEDKTVGV